MYTAEYLKKVAMTISGALIAIPGIASGFYFVYMLVTAIGNN